jgi:hypothetical protein
MCEHVFHLLFFQNLALQQFQGFRANKKRPGINSGALQHMVDIQQCFMLPGDGDAYNRTGYFLRCSWTQCYD